MELNAVCSDSGGKGQRRTSRIDPRTDGSSAPQPAALPVPRTSAVVPLPLRDEGGARMVEILTLLSMVAEWEEVHPGLNSSSQPLLDLLCTCPPLFPTRPLLPSQPMMKRHPSIKTSASWTPWPPQGARSKQQATGDRQMRRFMIKVQQYHRARRQSGTQTPRSWRGCQGRFWPRWKA